MFNVLLVDDDWVVLECMVKFVRWDELGFRIVGTALSVQQALQILDTEYVDVILTDIVMPKRCGLELIHDALEVNPYIKTVILSSHEDFNYAKEAMRLGTFDFLTKPVNYDELRNIFRKLHSVLVNEQVEKKMRMEYRNSLQAQFFNNLVNGYFHNAEQIREKADEIGFEPRSSKFCLLRVLIEEAVSVGEPISEREIPGVKSWIADKAGKFFTEFGESYVIDNSPKEIAVMFYPQDPLQTESIFTEFSDLIIREGMHNICMGAGNLYLTLIDASKSFSEAGKALEYRFVKKESCLFYHRVSSFFRGRSVITPEIETMIQQQLVTGDSAAFKEYIMGIINQLQRLEEANKGIIYDACIEILLIINRVLLNYVDHTEDFKQKEYTTIRTLLKKNNFEEIKDFFSGFLEESTAIISANREKPMGIAIESVIKYIHEHYNEDITLQKLSEIAYLHPIYLCKLFKERTGENFMEYLMKIRIERSMKLLADLSLRIYDVCEMVGYESPQHFSKIFKEVVGVTPKDYRKNLRVE